MNLSRKTSATWPRILGWNVFAALAGLGCVVLPPMLIPGSNPNPAYGHPLILWFAKAFNNAHLVPTFASLFVVGTVLGLVQRGWWPLSCCMTVFLVLVLNCVNIVHDWTNDPTSHNLFPFEIAMVIFLALPALIGGAIGTTIRRAIQRRKAAPHA